jgi:hypothetical protein
MKSVRSWPFDAVIGIGGVGREAEHRGIAGKLTWVGIGPRRTGNRRRPCVTFDHFLYYGKKGALFEKMAPTLARHIYTRNVRTIMDSLSDKERAETERILRTALKAPASPALLHDAGDLITKRRVQDRDGCSVRIPASGASVAKANRSTKC